MDVGVGDFVGPPNADIKDRTYVGNQNSEMGQSKQDNIPLDRPILDFGQRQVKLKLFKQTYLLTLSSSPWN